MGTTSANMAGFNDVLGKDWQSQYDNEVQAVQSRVQHHWHFRDEKGNEVPMPYCKLKKTSKKTSCQCKMGFPRKVLPKVRPRVVCPGNAASLGLQCSGRRNALGSIAGPRRCAYFSATSRILSKLHKSNTNVQLPYRLPLLHSTHDPECSSEKCLSKKVKRRQHLIGQRAVKQMMGYFGGYISKRQKIGRFERYRTHGLWPL